MFSIDLWITWTTIDRQGPQYKPFVKKETIFNNKPVLLSEIEDRILTLYRSKSLLVEKIELQEPEKEVKAA